MNIFGTLLIMVMCFIIGALSAWIKLENEYREAIEDYEDRNQELTCKLHAQMETRQRAEEWVESLKEEQK